MKGSPVPLLTLLMALAPGLRALGAPAAEPLDFNRDIRPILSDKCFACHGPDDNKRKANLRFDQRESATQPARSGQPAIVPNHPDQSELITRITTEDLDDRMPPSDFGKTLKPVEVERLRRWIAEGAEFHEHWAFVPPRRPPVPDSTQVAGDMRNPIDAFIGARLEAEKLTPQPEADRATLARRVTLDLTGLPPSPEEVDAFLADPSPDAYETLVDRLLESPHYGERQALEWLDASRFADTHGYHLDSGRDMTAWRDWVIRAYNENLPFDEFTVDQLAGDLLPDPTTDQRVATGFNRNHMINYEGGAIPEEYHYAYLVDRVNTTSTVWLGLTMTCAQCHDHKYDPLSKADFYGMFALFNNVPERGLDGNRGNAAPVLQLTTPEQDRELGRLRAAVAAAEKRLEGPLPDIDRQQADWERATAEAHPPAWTPAPSLSAKASGGAEFHVLDDGTVRVSGPRADQDTYTIAFSNPLPRLTALRLEALTDPSLSRQGPGRSANGNFVLTGVRLAQGEKAVRWKQASADFSQSGYPVAAAIDGKPGSGWAVDGGIGKAHAAIFELEEPLGPGPATVTLEFRSSFAAHAIGRFRLSLTESATPHADEVLPPEIQGTLAKARDHRSADERDRLRKYYRDQVSSEYRQLKADLAERRKARDAFEAALPTAMVMAEMEKPRDTFIHLRGQYDQKGDRVLPHTPAALPPWPSGEPTNRLGFARWLIDPNHPLTARVTVNRFWQMYFGTGIVKTTEDFGSQGEWPSHPKLLDWLAREFIDSGWNVKHLQRLIVTSAAYRRSSRVTPELHQHDPENRLLARGPRFRLPAEFIRDQALALSGLLNPVIGGHSVSPYQPPGLWAELSMREDSDKFSAQFFVQSHGSDLYRRSMYTFWKRSSPPPQMVTFDAPNRETCTVRRPRTNTPLQALILLNDPTYVEASRKLAERILARLGSDADRVAWAFRLATARFPSAREHTTLLRILAEQRSHYRSHRDDAEALLTNGESPRDLTLDPAELAAWTMVSSTILNLDETITKG